MLTIRTSYDRSEARRDHRYPRPTLFLLVGDRHYVCANWSLGGFLLRDYAGAATVGAIIAGEMRFEGTGAAPFKAEAVRVGPQPGILAARFRELEDAAFDLLDRGISRKLFRPRGG
jgi:hypothetical protein